MEFDRTPASNTSSANQRELLELYFYHNTSRFEEAIEEAVQDLVQ